ncbi:MAG: site-specific DNA-methyltransferase [Saccharofermentans sp.]|nr:site-specific DNA-methyltransferase [Saccharofermentans sp.]
MIELKKNEQYKLVCGDCFDTLKKLPDASVDLILTDPPYNLANYSTGNMKFDWRAEINNDVAVWDEKPLDPASLLPEFKRVLKPTGNIFIFCSYNLLGDYHKVFDPEFDTFQFMAWHKTNPVPNIRKSSFLNSVELIVCCWNKGHTWNFTKQSEMHNFFESPICMGKERVKNNEGKNAHPTQKPVKLLEHIINIASKEGDVVLDCFMGVGSTAEAALKLNRKFIGVELEPEYMELTKKRLEPYL